MVVDEPARVQEEAAEDGGEAGHCRHLRRCGREGRGGGDGCRGGWGRAGTSNCTPLHAVRREVVAIAMEWVGSSSISSCTE